MDAAGMKRRSASMVEGSNDKCKNSGMKQYDGMCRCSLAVVALRSKTNANPGRLSSGGKLKQKSTRKLSESVQYEDIDPMVLPVLRKELKEKLRRIEILLIMMCIGVAIGVFINFFALFKN
ncbi:uncharacterized protein DS421_5g144200 [Arachis hypogaea]|nr:uncharacterized protein DS421_5g144200 [Arachis hypogaea]